MDSRQIETLVAVADHGSLAEAARWLGLTPGAVAQRIQTLEAEIGAALLHRVGRRTALTEAGHAALPHAREMLRQSRALTAAAHDDSGAGALRLGAISTAITGLLPAALARMRQAAPRVEVFVRPGPSKDLCAAVRDGDLDAALVVKPPFTLPKTLDWRGLRREPLRLFAPPALAGHSVSDLIRDQPFIRYDRANWGGVLVQQVLDREGLLPNDWLELDQVEAIALLVSRGLGVAILPEWPAPWPAGLQVARLPLPGPPVVRELGLVWSREGPAARLAGRFLDHLASTAPG